MDKIKVGFIGCGQIARLRHIKELVDHPRVEFAAFCDIVQESAREFADLYGGKAYTDHRELLKEKDIDAVFVLNANIAHAKTAVDALNAGKHVMCEKPMAVSLEECRAMIEAAEKNDKILMTGYNQRLVPTHVKAREIIASGEYGRVLTVRSTFGHRGSEYFSLGGLSTWLYKKELAGFGVIGDLGVHKIDLIQFLLNDKISEVSAIVDTLAKKNDKGVKIDVDDNALCIFRTAKGIIGSMTASWTYILEDNSTSIYFEKATMKILESPEYDIQIAEHDGAVKTYSLGGIQTNKNQFKTGIPEEFINSIAENRKPIIGLGDGLDAIKVVLACLESSATGSRVIIKN